MRLVCPNCEAKYEVPEDAIPETGRDVQCANCGHAWFQMRPRSAAAETAAAPVVPATAPVVEPEPEPAVVAVDEVSVEVEAAAEVDAEAPVAEPPSDQTPEAVAEVPVVDEGPALEASDAEDAADVTSAGDTVAEAVVMEEAAEVADAAPEAEAAEVSGLAAAAVPAAYAVDDSVLAILREEAEREALARRAEVAKPLETQTDLGIESAIPATRKPVAAVAAVAEVETDDKLANRRTRLPDVEEINSTLRPAEAAGDGLADGMPVAAEGRSSFRSGFLMVLTVAILGSAIYGAADAIAAAVPALAGPLKAYVGFVDSLRLQLDGLMQSATVAINGN
jgi:predicted Zn finger-like uncharacterized protein